MAEKVPDSLVEEFKRTGAVCIRQAFSQEWLERIARGLDQITSNPRYLLSVTCCLTTIGKLVMAFIQMLSVVSFNRKLGKTSKLTNLSPRATAYHASDAAGVVRSYLPRTLAVPKCPRNDVPILSKPGAWYSQDHVPCTPSSKPCTLDPRIKKIDTKVE